MVFDRPSRIGRGELSVQVYYALGLYADSFGASETFLLSDSLT